MDICLPAVQIHPHIQKRKKTASSRTGLINLRTSNCAMYRYNCHLCNTSIFLNFVIQGMCTRELLMHELKESALWRQRSNSPALTGPWREKKKSAALKWGATKFPARPQLINSCSVQVFQTTTVSLWFLNKFLYTQLIEVFCAGVCEMVVSDV